MSDLTERLRNVPIPCVTTGQFDAGLCVCCEAAAALEAAEAELARLEHQLQQAEEATTAAYKDAETAEAKLAAIKALHRPIMTYDGGWWPGCTMCGPTSDCHVRRILWPDASCPCTEVEGNHAVPCNACLPPESDDE